MTHTPGPWKVEDGGFVGGPVGYGRVCQFWNKFEEDFKNSEANAKLIATAPEMLEALKLLVQDNLTRMTRGMEVNLAAIHQAQQAIARTEKPAKEQA